MSAEVWSFLSNSTKSWLARQVIADQVLEKASVWLKMRDAEALRRGARTLEIENGRAKGANADRVVKATQRIADVCEHYGLEFFHQEDPRGCALYLSKAGAGMNDTNYSRFIPCYAS